MLISPKSQVWKHGKIKKFKSIKLNVFVTTNDLPPGILVIFNVLSQTVDIKEITKNYNNDDDDATLVQCCLSQRGKAYQTDGELADWKSWLSVRMAVWLIWRLTGCLAVWLHVNGATVATCRGCYFLSCELKQNRQKL